MSMNSNKDETNCCDVPAKPNSKSAELEASKAAESKLAGSSDKLATPAPKSGCC